MYTTGEAHKPHHAHHQHAHHQATHKHIHIPHYWKDVKIDIPQKSICHLVLERMEGADPNHIALECAQTGVRLTYGDAIRQTKATACYLVEHGYRPGDVLLINAPNIPHYPVFLHGALLASGVVSPASPLHSLEELVAQLVDSSSKFVVTVPPLLAITLEAAHAVGIPPERVIVVGGDGSHNTVTHTKVFSHAVFELPAFNREIRRDPALLPYSSGTSGKSKGVMLSHHNLVSNLLQLDSVEESTPTLIGVLPFFHIYGCMLLLNFGLYNRLTTAVIPRFDLQLFLETMQKWKISTAHLVPPIMVALAKHPIVDKYDLSNLKMIFSGAAPLGRETEQAIEKRLKCQVKQAWGMSEMSPAGAISPNQLLKAGSVGPLLPLTQGRIVINDESGRWIRDGGVREEGEIYIKGPQVMLGYLNRPDANKESLTDDGWLRTGDTAYYDEDGYIYITDRIKEFLKVKGHQVAPAELEATLLTHAHVADAAVVGSPDEEFGEVPKAFVVLQYNVQPSKEIAEDIQQFVQEHVAPYKRIRLIEFIDTIPKNAAGKILRRILRAQERARIEAEKNDAK